MLLATAASVPWWSVPAAVLAVIGIWSFLHSNKAVSDAGLAGIPSRFGSVRRGQSARSVAEAAANSAVALSLRIDQLEKEGTAKDNLIQSLRADVVRLERLVTQATWGEAVMKQLADNHKEIMQVLVPEPK